MRVLGLVVFSVISVLLLDEISIILRRGEASSDEVKGKSLTSFPVEVTVSLVEVFCECLRMLGSMRNSPGLDAKVNASPVSFC